VVAFRPLPTPPRPELSDRLLAAVAERDGGLANRLLQQWVHRRGLPSLEAWILGPLLSSQGPGASAWLRHCLEDTAQEPIAALETAGIETAGMETAVIEAAVIEMAAIAQALPEVPEVPESPGLDSPGFDVQVTQSPVIHSPAADSPAPAPASLAALRAWLPDRSDDLPLAG